MEHHDQEFSCLFKCMKENSTNAIIFPLIEDHVDSMRKMEAALDSLVFHDLYKITEPLLNKLCIVYSVESRKRFRAKILSEKHKQSYVKIHYIDENTTNTVSMAYIRQIPPDLMFYKTKHVEVSLHNLSFKKGFEKEMTKDLVSTMENKTMDVLIRAFDDEGIPIVDLYKNNVPILVYQEILEKFTPTQLTEDHLEKQDAVSVDQMISLKKTSSVESFEEEFLCTFSYVVDPYNIAVYPIIDTGAFIPEKIRTTSRGLVNSAYLERVKNPELNKRCFLCLPQNENCYLSLIVRCNYNKTCLKIRLLEFNTCLYVNVLYLYEIPDLQIESIVVTLNFKFDPKFDAIISSELNYILKDKRLNVVVRQSEPDRLLVVDMYEVGSSILVYQKLIDMLTTASQYKEEIKQNRSIISGNHKIKEEELKLKQNLDLDEDNLMTFDDIPADQTFNKQIMKR